MPKERQHVVLSRRPSATTGDALARNRLCHARTHGRFLVDGHEAVGTVACQAVEATGPVVLERPRIGTNAGAIQSRRDRVAIRDGDRAAFEAKNPLLRCGKAWAGKGQSHYRSIYQTTVDKQA